LVLLAIAIPYNNAITHHIRKFIDFFAFATGTII